MVARILLLTSRIISTGSRLP